MTKEQIPPVTLLHFKRLTTLSERSRLKKYS